MTMQPTNPTQPIPRWVGLLVAGAVLASVLAVIGYFVWSAVSGPKKSELVEVMPNIAQRQAANRAAAAGVVQRPNGSFVVRAGEVSMTAVKPAKQNTWNLQVSTTRADLATPEQRAVLTARFRLPIDPAFRKSLNVTPEQIKQLQQIPAGTNMAVSEADTTRLKGLWDAYLAAADKSEPERALVQAVGEIGRASIDGTRQEIAARVKKIQEILTPEQIAPFKQ